MAFHINELTTQTNAQAQQFKHAGLIVVGKFTALSHTSNLFTGTWNYKFYQMLEQNLKCYRVDNRQTAKTSKYANLVHMVVHFLKLLWYSASEFQNDLFFDEILFKRIEQINSQL